MIHALEIVPTNLLLDQEHPLPLVFNGRLIIESPRRLPTGIRELNKERNEITSGFLILLLS
jgi:hypothetical protein